TFLQRLAEALLAELHSTHLAFYVTSEEGLRRVGIAAEEPGPDDHAELGHTDDVVHTLPGVVAMPDERFVSLPGEHVWVVCSHPRRFDAVPDGDRRALSSAIRSAHDSYVQQRALRTAALNEQLQRTAVSAAMDAARTVELFLGAAISGLAGQHGFVGIQTNDDFEVLGVHGEIEASLEGVVVEEIAGTWIATVADGSKIQASATAFYALARPCAGGVLVCVVASARATTLSEATTRRVDRAIEIVASLHEADEERRRAKARGTQIVEALAAMVDSDPATPEHHGRVAEVARRVAEVVHLDAASRALVRRAALVHDIGRVDVEGAAGTALEFLHPRVGERLLRTFGEPPEVARLVALHHERADGLGFPVGIAPSPGDLSAWCLIVGECVVEFAEQTGTGLEEAFQRWIAEASSGVIPDDLRTQLLAA
ncbi:MAG: HD domain-containing protein, partial [Myxococcota bacterium]